MASSTHSSELVEQAQLASVRSDLQAQIANLSSQTDDASFNLKAALEALLNAPTLSASQLLSAAQPLISQAQMLQAIGPHQRQNEAAIAYVLSEQSLSEERERLHGIEGALFDERFQTDLHDAFARGGTDLVEAHDKATEEALAALARIDTQLAEDGLSANEKQALLEQRHAVLYGYVGELETLVERARERGVDGLEPLAERVREQREALEASALSPQQKRAKIAEAGREAAAVGVQFEGQEQTIILADTNHTEGRRLQNSNEQSVEFDAGAKHAFAFEDTPSGELFGFQPDAPQATGKPFSIDLP